MPKKRTLFSLSSLLAVMEADYGALNYPTNLMNIWPHHNPIFIRLSGGAAGGGWLSRALIEATYGHKLLVMAPSHMETANVQKLIAAADSVLFPSRRLNIDDWSEGVLLAGLNIGISQRLEQFGAIMEKRR